MALTLSVSVPEGVHGDVVPGSYKEVYLNVTGSASYTTGGDPVGLTQLQALVPALFIYTINVVNPYTNGTLAPLTVYNTATGKLQIFCTAAGATGFTEATSGGSFAAYTAQLRVVYR
jgi:hypothetical protein